MARGTDEADRGIEPGDKAPAETGGILPRRAGTRGGERVGEGACAFGAGGGGGKIADGIAAGLAEKRGGGVTEGVGWSGCGDRHIHKELTGSLRLMQRSVAGNSADFARVTKIGGNVDKKLTRGCKVRQLGVKSRWVGTDISNGGHQLW